MIDIVKIIIDVLCVILFSFITIIDKNVKTKIIFLLTTLFWTSTLTIDFISFFFFNK